MQQRQLRLGDILDDYCPRERRVTNHAVVAMIGSDVKQTRCTTCDAEHEYKHAKVPRQRRKAETPAALYSQTLASGPKRVAHDEAGNNGNQQSHDAHGESHDLEGHDLDGQELEGQELEAEPVPHDSDSMNAAGESIDESGEAIAHAGESSERTGESSEHRSESSERRGESIEPLEEDEDNEASEPAEEDGPVHRPLIRASLPRPEGQPPPTRPIPEFTIRQPGGRPNRFRPRHQRGGPQQQFGNRSNGNVAGGPPRGGGMRQGGGRPPQGGNMPRMSRRHGPPGRKRSK